MFHSWLCIDVKTLYGCETSPNIQTMLFLFHCKQKRYPSRFWVDPLISSFSIFTSSAHVVFLFIFYNFYYSILLTNSSKKLFPSLLTFRYMLKHSKNCFLYKSFNFDIYSINIFLCKKYDSNNYFSVINQSYFAS